MQLAHTLATLLILCSGSAAYLRGAHFAELGLHQGAGDVDVRRAYRQLALQLHPDKASMRQSYCCKHADWPCAC